MLIEKSEITVALASSDGRSWNAADAIETAISAYPQKHLFRAKIVGGTSGMQAWARNHRAPFTFIPTENGTVSGYAKAIIEGFKQGEFNYVIPMPESLFYHGLVNEIAATRFASRIAGLTREGSFIEGDKIACKELCRRAGIPVAPLWQVVDARDFEAVRKVCLEYCLQGGAVIKFPYRAAGKGSRVIISPWDIPGVYAEFISDYGEAYRQKHGDDLWPLLIESRMNGIEISFTIFVDAQGNFQILPTAMDYPERFYGPPGKYNPPTGGMGGISPHPLETPELMELAAESIVKPLILAMKREGILRSCILYPGCIADFDADGKPLSLRVCEINIRPGEPEFQVVARRLRNLGALFLAMFEGNLDEMQPEVKEEQIAMTMALVIGPGPGKKKGYPWSQYQRGELLRIDESALEKSGIFVIPSGMGYRNDAYIADGTRIIYLAGNTSRGKRTRGEAAGRLNGKLLSACGFVRVVPRDNPAGNRLAWRTDIGLQYEIADRLFGK